MNAGNFGRFYVVYLMGEKAARVGHEFQNGRCYRRILDNAGKFLAQLEVTLEDLVDVSFIESENNVKEVLRILAENGFAGISYQVCSYMDAECLDDEREEYSGTI